MREIAQPAREVKLLQRVLIKGVLSDLPVHEAAMAYRNGISVRDNASKHVGTSPILKMDFESFFPSIRSSDWERFCGRTGVLSSEDCRMSSRILFRRSKRERNLRLSIGAPSSPIISNVLLYNFDLKVSSEAQKRGIIFTRYADDLTFSGQRIGLLKDMERVVENVLREMREPRLNINNDKTTYVTTKNRRVVTGVTLTNNGSVSLGHDKKRLISAQVHHASLGKLSVSETKELAGQLAFFNVVEPTFILTLRRRYGDQVIDEVKRA